MRYHLRAMFIVVAFAAIPCGWLGNAYRLATRRAALITALENSGGGRVWWVGDGVSEPVEFIVEGDKGRTVSKVRYLFGDRDADAIMFYESDIRFSQAQLLKRRAIIEAFPEADICVPN